MKSNITELVFILDASGSMSGLEKDTIGGFNSMIEKQKKLDGKKYVSTVLFSDSTELLHDRIEIEDVGHITEDDYKVGGMTALYDSIGAVIYHISKIHKYIRPEDMPDSTIFAITTDGEENSSRLYSAERVRRMIEDATEKYGWEFLLFGANVNTNSIANQLGISDNRFSNYHSTSNGTRKLFNCMEQAFTLLSLEMELPLDWNDSLNDDE